MTKITAMIIVCFVSGVNASAVYAADSAFNWNGFIAQGFIHAGDNSFVNEDSSWSSELTELGLNARYQLAPAWHISGQAVYLQGGNRYPPGLRLDYLFIDWAAYSSETWQANAYLGRFKNQHWLYSSTRDVPFTRPSIVLPQSVYFDAFRDIAVSSDGLSLQARNSNALGDVTINWSLGYTPVSTEQSQLLLGRAIEGKTQQEFVHQASLYWQPSMSRFSYGISLLDSDFTYNPAGQEPFAAADFTVQRVMLSLRYQAEFWELSSEIQQERLHINGFFAPQFTQNQFGLGGYILAQYHQSPQLSWFGVVDYAAASKDDLRGRKLQQTTGTPAFFGYQQSAGLGFNYDISKQLRVAAEVHWVEGTGRLSPVLLPDVQSNMHQYWQMVAVQLMYRF